MIQFIGFALAAALAVYTQIFHLTSVPGLHFDEGWQGMFAVRILTEPDFFPTGAMNSYTSPVIHYILAAVFKFFSPSLVAMRGFYAFMNLSSLAIFSTLIWKNIGRLSALWFLLFWGLLPLFVHDHRFYVEMTGFFGFCFAIFVLGLNSWKKNPLIASFLIFLSTILATYSHILFISIFVTALLVLPLHFPEEFEKKFTRIFIAFTAFALLPLPIRMGIGLKKLLPFCLAAAIFGIGIFSLSKKQFPKSSTRLFQIFFWITTPFLAPFILLLWNGFWPYAQATGKLQLLWLPINAGIFIFILFKSRKHQTAMSQLLWQSFVCTFAISSAMILKQSPRYYMIPTILASFWICYFLPRLLSMRKQIILMSGFLIWNFAMFQTAYIRSFEKAGPTNHEFRIGFFHDNARDFRPFQKVMEWAIKNNCQQELQWVEDDRFGKPMDFLRLTVTPPHGPCPWQKHNLFLSHIPNYDPEFKGLRTEENTPPPVENVKFLAHFPEWGDLALWTRKW